MRPHTLPNSIDRSEVVSRLFDLSTRFKVRSKLLLMAKNRTKEQLMFGLILEYMANELEEVFADLIQCAGEG